MTPKWTRFTRKWKLRCVSCTAAIGEAVAELGGSVQLVCQLVVLLEGSSRDRLQTRRVIQNPS